MDVNRREFVQMASLGAGTALANGYTAEATSLPPEATPGQLPPVAAADLKQLKLTIWGSCVYVFSNSYKQLDVAFMANTNVKPDVYGVNQNIRHVPMMEMVNARVVNGAVTIKDGHWMLPGGNIFIEPESLDGARDLEIVGLAEETKCPVNVEQNPNYQLSGFSYIPQLKAQGGSIVPQTWRNRATTYINLTKGKIDAIKPLTGAGDISEWDMRYKHDGTPISKQVVTNTTLYTVPLKTPSVKFNVAGQLVEIAVVDTSKTWELILRAGPHIVVSTPLDPNNKLHHFEALYHLFEPIPEHQNRGALYLTKRCDGKLLPTEPKGDPFPGDLCPGAFVSI